MPLHKYWPNIVREVFPGAVILDAALEFPITENGWRVELPSPEDLPWTLPDLDLF